MQRCVAASVPPSCLPLAHPPASPQPTAREGATRAVQALAHAAGPEAVVGLLLDKGVVHKNWRVREGVFSMYAWQAEEFAAGAAVSTSLTGPGADALGDAQPDVRRAAADALARLGMQVGLARVVSQVEERGARPAHVKAVRDRYAELGGQGGAGAAPPPPPAQRLVEHPEPTAAPPVVAKLAPPIVAKVAAPAGRAASAGAAALAPLPAAAPYRPALELVTGSSDEQLCAYPALVTLTHLSGGPWWEPGIPNDGDALRDEIGRPKPLPIPAARDLARAVDDFCSTCSTTTVDWKERSAALEKLRGLIAGGLVNADGFAAIVPRLREPLCVQVQDLRSSICKLACCAAAELSACCGNTHWFEPLADALVETLSKLTYVTISVIAQSAHACICAILHNTRAGFPKVLAKLTAAARTRSPVLRARAAEYLLVAIRSWSTPCLERQADDLQSALASLLVDADPTARQCARLAYWSFISSFPAREAAILTRLDGNAQRLLSEDLALARGYALQVSAARSGCDTALPLPHTRAAPPTQPQAVRMPVMLVPCRGDIPVASMPSFAPAAPPAVRPVVRKPLGAAVGAATSAPPVPAVLPRTSLAPAAPPMHARAASAPEVAGAKKPVAAAVPKVPVREAVVEAEAGEYDAGYGPTAAAYAQYSYAQSGANTLLPPQDAGRGAAHHARTSSAPSSAATTPTRPSAAVRPLAPPTPVPIAPVVVEAPPLSAQAARELLHGAVARLAAGDSDGKGTRDRLADLLNAATRVKAVDARSIVRSYGSGERVPPAVSLPASAITAAHASMASARTGSSPGHVSYPPLTSPTPQLEPGGIRAMLDALEGGRLQRGLRAALTSAHELVVCDGLSVLSTLLDSHADAYSLLILGFGPRCLGPEALIGSDNTLRLPPAGLAVVASHVPPSVTLVPVYGRLLLLGPDGDRTDGGTMSPGGVAGGGAVSDVFRGLFMSVLQCTSGATERVCSSGKRALACMRRAYPVPALLAVTLATLLTDATPRVQMVALHLVRDMLSDPGGSEYFAVEPRPQRLLARMADMLISCSRGGSGVDPASPTSPFYGLPDLLDALIAALAQGSMRAACLSGLSRLSPDQLRALVMVADADVGGGGSTPGLQEAVFKAKHAAVATAAYSTAGQVQAAPVRASAPTPAARDAAPAQPLRPVVAAPAPAAEGDLPPGFPHVIPLSRANLELVIDTIASGDKAKQLRALHYFGRAVDTVSPTAAPSAGGAAVAVRAVAFVPPAHPDTSSPMLRLPAVHATDPLWLSLFDRVVTAVLACVPLGAGGADGAPAAAASADALAMTQTALSVVRKLFRNCTAYVAGKTGGVLGALLGALRGAPKEVANVLERTLEEVTDRLPPDLALAHCVTCLTSADPGDAGQAAPVSVCLRILARLLPALPPQTLVHELGKGRLMEGVRRAFLSTSTDVRRSVVGLLVELWACLEDSDLFARDVASYLTAPQQKLLDIYIRKGADA